MYRERQGYTGLTDIGMQPEALIAAVEQAADGIVVTDTAAIIRYVNPAFTLLTGCTSEESVGRNTNMLRAGAAGPSLRN